jgi:O-antigen ligase
MAAFAFRREPAIIRLLFFLAPVITLVIPLTTVAALILLAIATVTLAVLHGRSLKELVRFDLGLALFAVAVAYLLVNATWSLEPSKAYGKAAWFALATLMTFATCRALSTWDKPAIRTAAIAFLCGVLAGAAVVLIEIVTELALTRALFNVFPSTRPDSVKSLVIRDGEVIAINTFELNRNVAVLLLALWPALLCLSGLKEARWRPAAAGALCLTVTVAVGLSNHESSKLGLLVSAITFLVAWLWPNVARRGLLAAWCLVFALVVPLSTFALKAELHKAEWLPMSAQARIILWAFTADKVADAPLLGIGLGSQRVLDKKQPHPELAPKPEGYVFGWRGGAHAHNEFLQTWYELGAIGVLLLLAAGCGVIASIGRLSAAAQPFILAHFAAFFAIAALSWGMWQSWLIAATGLAAVYAAMAARAAEVQAPAAEEGRDRARARPQVPLGAKIG